MTSKAGTLRSPSMGKTAAFASTESGLPELTFKAIFLGFLLAVVLCASNVYVALKVGRTISGSIPAAVLSMLILRFWRQTSILEHNIVQTTASAGEVVSAGITFTIPALLMMGLWDQFHYLETMAIALVGGFLGVAFSVPLRRSMIVQQKLPYPEGIATAAVLKSGEHSDSGKLLVSGGMFAAVVSFFQEGSKWLATDFHLWKFFGKTPVGFGFELSPVLMGAGYIVGLRTSLSMLLGSVITWAIALPLYCSLYGIPASVDPQMAAVAIWKSKLRFMGVGAMIVGGLWGMISLSKVIIEAITTSLKAIKDKQSLRYEDVRTERDMPMNYVLMMTGILALPMLYLFYTSLAVPLDLTATHSLVVVVGSLVFALLIAFGCAAIGSFITGVVGSTLMPVSGITISAILMFGSVLFVLLGGSSGLAFDQGHALSVAGATILFAAIIAMSSSVSGDNMQDLKAGALVGSTPWKQQVMLLVGVVGGAIIVAPVLQLLFQAYGIGDAMPRAGMDPAATLKAPQATMMATMAKGFFAGGIEWTMVYIGAAIAAVVIVADQYLKAQGHANVLPILSVAFGMYMPASYILTFVLGGLAAHFASKRREKYSEFEKAASEQSGVLYASGIIAGTAMMGVLVSIPLAQGIDLAAYFPVLPSGLVMLGGLGACGMLVHTFARRY